ncbi:MAG TPA: response regulator [Bryobacteraceae bacterium]|nr:response regulator [Bryobacteraceae bacterium]
MPTPSTDPVDLRGLATLIVDDNSTNRLILVQTLSKWGINVTAAESGPAALAAFEDSIARGAPFHLAILDVQMPSMDGFELAGRIRSLPESCVTAMIVLSSSGQQSDTVRCKELGIAGYLQKPVKRADLLNCIHMALGAARDETLVPVIPQPQPETGRRILLAEDNTVNQRLALRLLERQGHSVVIVSNGRQAVDAVDSESFDVVLMDVQMPEMDGLQATALIREKERAHGTRIPIIALTAHAMKGDRERCIAAGMDGYLSKPIQAEELYAAIPQAIIAAAPSRYS